MGRYLCPQYVFWVLTATTRFVSGYFCVCLRWLGWCWVGILRDDFDIILCTMWIICWVLMFLDYAVCSVLIIRPDASDTVYNIECYASVNHGFLFHHVLIAVPPIFILEWKRTSYNHTLFFTANNTASYLYSNGQVLHANCVLPARRLQLLQVRGYD